MYPGNSEMAMEVVGEAANGNDALDPVIPAMDGIQAIPKLKDCSPESPIMVLTSFGEQDTD